METIDNYQIFRTKDTELGRGSFSIVYSGLYIGPDNKFIKSNTKIAIKIIKTRDLNKKAHEILEEEISIMEMIKQNPHPNIVRCYDVIRKEQTHELYIIMEYCDSGDLRNILRKPIKEKYAQFYFSQLANGLRYLDKHFIIHRDIKPKNILLTNSRRILKIADFGFAKRFGEKSLHETICGSPLYMAPEIMNSNMYNNQTDLWSIGMILYEMLYGNHPFGSCKTIPELKEKLAKNIIEIPPSNTKNKDVTDDCISLLKHLLQKQATERISWEGFFIHPWINTYQYTTKMHDQYETQLFSTSLGSLTTHSLSSTPKTIGESLNSYNNTPVVKMSCLENLVIVEDFCDKIEDSYNDKDKEKEKEQIDFGVFEMELDDKPDNKKIIIKRISDIPTISNLDL